MPLENLVAVDPGEKHCGVAWFIEGKLHRTWTSGPVEFIDWLWDQTAIHRIVLEEYRLYPWLLQQQGFSAVETVEVIGVVKHLCRRRRIPLTMQPASLKKPAEGITQARGISLTGSTRHARDAELHGWFYLLKSGHAAMPRMRED